MKLVFFTRKLDLNDSRIGFAHTWAEKLAERCEKLYVICLEKGTVNLPKNVEVFELGKGKFRRFWHYNSLLRTLSPDAIFCHMNPIYVIISGPYARLKHKRLVMWYAHGSVSMKLRLATFFADRILSSSADGFRLKSKKVRFIGQAIDIEKFSPSRKTTKHPVLLSIGRMSPIKRYETLIKAMPAILKNRPETELRIVTNAELESEKEYMELLEDLVSSLNLQSNVSFLQGVPFEEVPKLYADCDIFVSDSQTGSLDKVVLEAMACGRPVLVSNKAFSVPLGIYSNSLIFSSGDYNELCKKTKSLLSVKGSKKEELDSFLRAVVETPHNINGFISKVIAELVPNEKI
jgi:glycosyltransferase involved in cell wall biosynthesis